MQFTEKTDGRRTLLYDEDGLHVGTIYEVASAKELKGNGREGAGLYNWYARSTSGRADSKEAARTSIVKEIHR